MKIDPVKLQRQEEFLTKWIDNKGKGTLEASTGFGKTYVGVLVIRSMLERNPERTTLIVVPRVKLKSQWEREIKKHALQHVSVSIINSAVKLNRSCSLLILDEIHNYAAPIFGTVFQKVKYSFILGLTASFERSDKKHYYVDQYCPVIDTVDLEESLAKGFVSDFLVFNLPVPMSGEEKSVYESMNKMYHKWFALFDHNFDRAMLCLNNPSYRKVYAKQLNWEDKDVYVYALQWMRNMQNRKKFLYSLPGKLTAALSLIESFPRRKIITFSESTSFVDMLQKRTSPYSVAYHSKISLNLRKKNVEQFENPDSNIRVIHTAKSLDEGFDVEGIEMAIVCSGTSTIRQNIQRMGRSIRFSEGKTGIIINLYVPDTQDTKWLTKRQSTTLNVFKVKSIADIIARIDGNQMEIDFTDEGEADDTELSGIDYQDPPKGEVSDRYIIGSDPYSS